ncbi:hypothetical protein JQX13_49525 [Archangium violaceum]|uniref:hypothetical protein n=1 Tax=Archangium violaceum TaxID=83451 RepID=UPI00193C72C5|nr:hypothetical protein [Archangium violaceum]QRK14244.1 hypothetical protein JQX13_49525 [Archangium violaceum]
MPATFHTRVVPIVVLLSLSAYAAGESAGAVDFKNTISMLSRLFRQGEYEQAVDVIELVRQRPLGTSELVTLSLYEGIILFELGKHEESGDAFQMALMLRLDAKLPEPVSPKIESLFEASLRKVQQELSPPAPAPSTPGGSSPDCPSARIAAKGRTLKAQQLWRLASMDQMLCVRGLRKGTVIGALSALKAQVTEAATSTEWVRVTQDIERFAHQFAVYPSNEDWRKAKSTVPEELWELGDEDQDVPLPEEPPVPVVKSQPEEEPTNLFGCLAAVAPECERLMMRLIPLQTRADGMEAAKKGPAKKELFRLGKKIREARSSETLAEASREIDAWQAKSH